MNNEITIARIGKNTTVNFACEELRKYLKQIDNTCVVEIRSYREYQPKIKNMIWVGLTDSVTKSNHDTVFIDVNCASGVISGSNERSVLMSVYRFLYELGCRFYRFDEGGEYIPSFYLSQADLSVKVNETASYKHRAVCIEGAVSYEHIYNMINWLPKVGLNGYYVQFQKPHTFFARWTEHTGNPKLTPGKLTNDDCLAIYDKLKEEIKLRGLMLHAVGHGWTCEPLGIDGNGWYKNTEALPCEKAELLALTNGKRQFFNGIPLNTNLCYSNESVRELMTDSIVRYCKENPDVDYLHFWLGDDKNNQCECPKCSELRPADYYIMMLNLLDKKLSEQNVNTKIVFLIYYDLLWKGLTEKIENQDRFVLMFAPISRTYKNAFCDADVSDLPQIPDYVRNELVMPKSVQENLAFLKSWQEDFTGDSFDFDYHLMWDHVRDFGYFECAKILHKDMCCLDNIKLDGMVSCQIQRCAYPTNLPMYAMAKGLWNKTSDFNAIADEYFKSEFLEYADVVKEYLCELSKMLDIEYIRKQKESKDDILAIQFLKAADYIYDFQTNVIKKHINDSKSWQYLNHHAESTRIFALAFSAKANNDDEKKLCYAKLAVDYIREHEMELNQILDVCNYQYVLCRSLECEIDGVVA